MPPLAATSVRDAAVVLLAALAAAAAGCAGSDQRGGDPGTSASDGAGDDRPSPDTAAARDDLPVCLQADRYVADGPVAVAPPPGGDAQRIADLRWGRHPGCERFVIDLATADGQQAATPGVVVVDMARELGILRVQLRELDGVVAGATDAMFAGPLARAAYAVRAPGGRGMFVDLHLGEPAEAAVLVLHDPARVVVDLRPGGGPLPPPAATSDRVVVLEPRPGQASYPLTVTGYARTFEANVVARLERDGRQVQETFTTATAWADAWGHYSMTLGTGPPGEVRLHVGEHSARDGTWEGVELRLDMP